MRNVTSLSRAFGALAAAGALSLSLIGAASAGVLFTEDVGAPAALYAVSFPPLTTTEGPANLVTGRVNIPGPVTGRPLIEFRSMEELITDSSPASILSTDDNGIQNFTVQLADGVFNAFFFNAFALAENRNPPGRFAAITVYDTNGAAHLYSEELRNNGNRLLIHATAGELFTRVEFSTTENITSVRGIQIGGIQASPVPEPATLWILGAGLLGMSLLRRSKRS